MGQRSRRPGEQKQDSQKRERITFVRAQFRRPPIRSNLSENYDLTSYAVKEAVKTMIYL
jgi:hypothetical protein